MIFVLSLLCSVLLNFSAAAAPLVAEGTDLAVLDFGTHAGATTLEVALANAEKTSSEYIISGFVENGKYNVKDKDVVQEKLSRYRIKTTGILDPRQLYQLQEILGVRYIVYGNVNNVSVSENGTNVASPLPSLGGNVNVYTVSCQIIGRVIDAQTGYIIAAAKGEGKSRSSMTEVNTLHGGIKIGTVTLTQESVHNAVKKAAYNLSEKLACKLAGVEFGNKGKKK